MEPGFAFAGPTWAERRSRGDLKRTRSSTHSPLPYFELPFNHMLPLYSPDITEAHILRSLANVPAVSVYTSHSGCHAVVLDKWGTVYLFGRNASSCLGIPSTTDAVISEQEPRTLRPVNVGASDTAKFVSAACGRSHTLLITDDGEVYSAGNNTLGQVRKLAGQWLHTLVEIALPTISQCGHSPRPEITSFTRIHGPWSSADKAKSAVCGITFSLVLTKSGKGDCPIFILAVHFMDSPKKRISVMRFDVDS